MKNNIIHVNFCKSKRQHSSQVKSLSYSDLDTRNTRLLKTEGELRRKLLDHKRTLLNYSKKIARRDGEIGDLQIELSELRERFKLLRESLARAKESTGGTAIKDEVAVEPTSERSFMPIGDASLVNNLQRKVAPALAGLLPRITKDHNAKENDGKQSDKTDRGVSQERQFQIFESSRRGGSNNAGKKQRTWRIVRHSLPKKTGLYLVSDGRHTELSYFNKARGEFTTKTIKIEYWAEQNATI